jgi:hypothetical protein
MAGPKLDGPGTVKLETLEESLTMLQSVHGLVERMAMEVKNGKPLGTMTQQFKRIATPLVGKLKSQFQLISDLISGMLLIAGRGGPDAMKVRAFREGVAQARTQIEIAITQTKEKHAVKEAPAEE